MNLSEPPTSFIRHSLFIKKLLIKKDKTKIDGFKKNKNIQ